MTEQTAQKLQRLSDAGIEILPAELRTHFLCARESFVALVERTDEGFGNVGNAGMLTEKGLAFLIWRGDEGWFVGKGFEQLATEQQIQDLSRFGRDLGQALRSDR